MKKLVGTLVAGIVCFAGLAVWVEAGGTPGWDGRLLAAIAGGEELDGAALAVTYATDAIGVAAAAAVFFSWLLLWQRRRADALFFAAILVATSALLWVLKLAFDRPRPLEDAAGPTAGASFPSGHAMTSMAIVLALLLLARTNRGRAAVTLAGGLLTVGIAWSRLELGAHFPSDVLAGWAVSLATVAAFALLVASHSTGGRGHARTALPWAGRQHFRQVLAEDRERLFRAPSRSQPIGQVRTLSLARRVARG